MSIIDPNATFTATTGDGPPPEGLDLQYLRDQLARAEVIQPGPRLQLVESFLMVETNGRQVRFPRSKKRRIRRKWAKDRRNWVFETEPMEAVLRIGNRLVMHPDVAEQLRQFRLELNQRLEREFLFGSRRPAAL